jgi:HAD superfamily hydrolase (TIGR01509 family)
MDLKAVIMDFDGVVLDSFREGLRRIRVLAALHDKPFGRDTRRRLTRLWGLPGIELLMQGLDISRALAERIYVDWEKMDLLDPIPLVPGSRETLYWLRQNEIAKSLITSRHRENLLSILDRDDLLREFDIVTTKQDSPYHKPDPRVFAHALSALEERNIEPEQCIFVGDTPSDIVAGQDAKLRTLVVQTGPYLLKHATEFPIDLSDVLQSIDDLPMWIEEHHTGKLKVFPS